MFGDSNCSRFLFHSYSCSLLGNFLDCLFLVCITFESLTNNNSSSYLSLPCVRWSPLIPSTSSYLPKHYIPLQTNQMSFFVLLTQTVHARYFFLLLLLRFWEVCCNWLINRNGMLCSGKQVGESEGVKETIIVSTSGRFRKLIIYLNKIN